MASGVIPFLIKENDFVIVKTETALRVMQVRKDRPQFLGKRKIHIASVIGHPYSSFFEINGNGVLEPSRLVTDLIFPSNDSTDIKDNRALSNSGSSQKLTTDDIEAFKAEGVPGEEIVKIIVENSSSFKEKSLYSQEKYLKKKQQKYINYVQILKTSSRFLSETYYQLHPQKILNLRVDSLSQMLTFCNVMSGGKYIVVDAILGLLTAAVLERIGSEGLIVQVHMGPAPPNTYRQAIDALNYSGDKLEQLLHSIDFFKAVTVLHPMKSEVRAHEDNISYMDVSSETVESEATNLGNGITEKQKQEISTKRMEKQLYIEKVKSELSEKNFDSLLVAIKHHPSDVLQLLDLLEYSRPFAFFSMYQQPLIDCYISLKSRGDIILLNISDTWMRKYQVLPERTHPDYNMYCNSGFVLTGIKVETKLGS